MKRKLRIALISIVVLGILGLGIARLLVDEVVRASIEEAGRRIAQVSVKLDKVQLSLLTGEGQFRQLQIGNPTGFHGSTAIQVREVSIELHPSSILSKKWVFPRVRIVDPRLTLEGSLGSNNLTRILHNVETNLASGLRIQVNDLIITGTSVTVTNDASGNRPVTLRIPDIQLRGLGKGPNGITTAEASQRIMSRILSEVLAASFQNLEEAGRTMLKALFGQKPKNRAVTE